MKLLARFSAWVAFAAFLCCAPCAFGQSTVNSKLAGTENHVLNYASSSFLAFALSPSGDHVDRDHRDRDHGGGGDGCGNQGGGGGGWGGGGWDDGWGGGGGNGGGGCTPVPEGGTALMYLSLASLCCLGAMVLRSRRQASMRGTSKILS